MNPARQRFIDLAAVPDSLIDVAYAALVIAQEEYPSLDVGAYLQRFDALADSARVGLRSGMAPGEEVAYLNRFLFLKCGFAGNHDHYYDPRNSFLNEVLDRHTGIPISLSIVYSEVAQRLDLPVVGVNFPGHFLVKYASDTEIIIDPFFGTVISTDECAQRLRAIYGRRAHLDDRVLRPATPREILVRLLSNLKQIYVDSSEFVRALACVDRILLLTPQVPREIRDRGILYQRLECYVAALRDFQHYLQLAPDDPAARIIRDTLPDLQRRAAQLQ
jgi:regulator of sirC expression with transglutaminase-like and TPR domain